MKNDFETVRVQWGEGGHGAPGKWTVIHYKAWDLYGVDHAAFVGPEIICIVSETTGYESY